jgi:hypothetical protein
MSLSSFLGRIVFLAPRPVSVAAKNGNTAAWRVIAGSFAAAAFQAQ